jgi:hypothetical protein
MVGQKVILNVTTDPNTNGKFCLKCVSGADKFDLMVDTL